MSKDLERKLERAIYLLGELVEQNYMTGCGRRPTAYIPQAEWQEIAELCNNQDAIETIADYLSEGIDSNESYDEDNDSHPDIAYKLCPTEEFAKDFAQKDPLFALETALQNTDHDLLITTLRTLRDVSGEDGYEQWFEIGSNIDYIDIEKMLYSVNEGNDKPEFKSLFGVLTQEKAKMIAEYDPVRSFSIINLPYLMVEGESQIKQLATNGDYEPLLEAYRVLAHSGGWRCGRDIMLFEGFLDKDMPYLGEFIQTALESQDYHILLKFAEVLADENIEESLALFYSVPKDVQEATEDSIYGDTLKYLGVLQSARSILDNVKDSLGVDLDFDVRVNDDDPGSYATIQYQKFNGGEDGTITKARSETGTISEARA